MSGDVQMKLCLHEYKMKALSEVLAKEETTVEQEMQDALTALYVTVVPPEVRYEISVRIKEDLAAQEAKIEASRKCAVFHVRENVRDEYFRADENQELLYTARNLRRYLCQEPGMEAASFSEMYPEREAITPEEFQRLVRLRVENTGKVTGAFDIDFDKQEFSALHTMNRWSTWGMEDVSAAACHAFLKSCLSEDAQYEILLDKLHGKEITPWSDRAMETAMIPLSQQM